MFPRCELHIDHLETGENVDFDSVDLGFCFTGELLGELGETIVAGSP